MKTHGHVGAMNVDEMTPNKEDEKHEQALSLKKYEQ